MKLINRYLLVTSITLGTVVFGFCNSKTSLQSNDGFVVVELFTSEGCSSCPPADAVAAKLSEEYKGKVFVLGFHVDYWDYLGWKDAFSNAAYSNRQTKYGNLFHLNSIYTPQVVINGEEEMVGSNESKIQAVIVNDLKEPASAAIQLEVTNTTGKNISIHYTIDKASNTNLNIALVQLHATSNVKRGENSGRTLQHVNVVRDFKTVDAKDLQGNIQLTIPQDIPGKDCKIIAFLQNKNDLKITAATETDIE